MLHELDEIAEVLIGTPFEGCGLRASPVSRSDHDSIELDVRSLEIDNFEAWQIARSLVDRTGRWPMLLPTFQPSEERGDAAVGAEMLRLAESADSDDLGRGLRERWTHLRGGSIDDLIVAEGPSYLEGQLTRTERRVGSAPELADLMAAIDPKASRFEMERWLHEWELEHGGDGLPSDEGWGRVFNTHFGDFAHVVHLLPVAAGWQVPTLLDLFDYEFWDGPIHVDPLEEYSSPALLAAILRRWDRDFRAEPWAWTGVEMFFDVGSPPTTLDAAWELMREHEVITDWVIHMEMNGYRDYVRALLGSSQWYVFNKP